MTLVSFDTETHLILPGLLTPPLVCASLASDKGTILDSVRESILRNAREILTSENTIVGANIAYDFGVLYAEDPSLITLIFNKYDRDQVYDILLAQALDAIGQGFLGIDPRDGGPLRSPSGKITNRYSLEICVDLVLGRKDTKKNDFWRLRYALLQGIPLEDWPEEGRQYPIDDAVNTLEVAKKQIQLAEKGEFLNLHNAPHQARTAWALHLASSWGMRTDPESVEGLSARIEVKHSEQVKKFQEVGIIKDDGKENGPYLKKLTARAYGASGTCQLCQGSGKVRSEVSKNFVVCKASQGGCDGTGLDVANAPSSLVRTDTGGVSVSRDTLSESGDDLLESYANVSELEKIRDTYLPFLRKGIDHPINPKPNALVATGRVSYESLVQLLPRSHGVRECFVPREGHYFCSIDYNSLELCTLAQCLLWIVGQSNMADALNEGKDLHSAFAASMTGMMYEDFVKQLKTGDKKLKGYRQAAKAPNFGYPGGMGPVKLVLAQRKIGLRFCKTLEDAECGVEKISVWKGKPTPPVCLRCVQLAEDLKSQWFSQWPEMHTYFDFVNGRVASGHILQYISERIRGNIDFCNGANTLFQGLAADGAKHALYRVSRECYTDSMSVLFGNRPVLFIHDEILSELRKDTAHLAAKRMSDIMIESMTEYVPDVRIGAEPALMGRWYKEAEPTYDENGKLIPWEPKS